MFQIIKTKYYHKTNFYKIKLERCAWKNITHNVSLTYVYKWTVNFNFKGKPGLCFYKESRYIVFQNVYISPQWTNSSYKKY